MSNTSSFFDPETGIEDDMKSSRSLVEPAKRAQNWSEIWERLVRLGLGEITLRIGTSLSSILLILLVAWVMRSVYLGEGQKAFTPNLPVEAAAPTPEPDVTLVQFSFTTDGLFSGGVLRMAQLHTNFPARPRFEVVQYTVEKGDTVFGIANKFNLSPETILWGNYYVLADDPHRLSPGQVLNILPVDGVYYEWNAGDGLNGVAGFYGVSPETVINWPGNHLEVATLGDWSNPNIEPGTWLVVPGGSREFVTWSAPRITRDNPAVAKLMGPGACGTVMDGPVGTGIFIWPTVQRFISGYDYSPETNHYAIDIGGNEGDALFATDNGVVVYAGWNDWGYGNVIVIDHGYGWQSLYAHLSALNVGCGSYVYQGDVIGYMGTTGNSSGPHLHFELRSDTYGKVNPKNFLQ